MPRTAKELKPTGELAGLSTRQVAEHHDVLYKGYVNKLNEIEAKSVEANPTEANATFSQLRELKREEVFATNAIRLHEGYFEGLVPGGKPLGGPIMAMIIEDFGSYAKWEAEFKGLGIAARGWVVLAYDWEDGRLHNYLSDIHSDGVWGALPLLILDVYEHAYFLDYGTGRKAYIEAFFKNINWDRVNYLASYPGLAAHRQATRGKS